MSGKALTDHQRARRFWSVIIDQLADIARVEFLCRDRRHVMLVPWRAAITGGRLRIDAVRRRGPSAGAGGVVTQVDSANAESVARLARAASL